MKLWIARDEDGSLHLFSSKPERVRTHFGEFYDDKWEIDDCQFPEVNWENSPQEVEITLFKPASTSVDEETKVDRELTYKEKYPIDRDAQEIEEEEGYDYLYDTYYELPCVDFLEESFWKEYIENMESLSWEFVQAVDYGLKEHGYSEIEVLWKKKNEKNKIQIPTDIKNSRTE